MTMPSFWAYHMPTRIVFGECIGQIGSIATEFGAKRALIVTGSTAMRKHGITTQVANSLRPIDVEIFDGVEPNPSMSTYENAQRMVREKRCDFVIGLGGGSPMDIAKAIAAVGKTEISVGDLFNPPVKIGDRLPTVAIPTTSGSGSEVTPFSIVTDVESGIKKVANHPLLYPNVALVDPSLCKTMPKNVTAHTGLDAISHAVEAYWSKRAQPISDIFALDALRHIMPNLKTAFDEPMNATARSEMALGSVQAGIAIGTSGSTATHAISFPLTVKFGIPHGLACYLTLPHFLKYNAASIPNKTPGLLRAMGVDSIDEAYKLMIQLVADMDQPTRLSEVGIGKDDIQWLVQHSFGSQRQRNAILNNPREAKEEDVERILAELL